MHTASCLAPYLSVPIATFLRLPVVDSSACGTRTLGAVSLCRCAASVPLSWRLFLVESRSPRWQGVGQSMVSAALQRPAVTGSTATEKPTFRVGLSGPPGAGKSEWPRRLLRVVLRLFDAFVHVPASVQQVHRMWQRQGGVCARATA